MRVETRLKNVQGLRVDPL